MFCHSVVPTLRSFYIKDRKNPGHVKHYMAKCKKVAEQVQLQPWQWPLVTLPFFMSMDWDTRHTWVRQVLACPRVQQEDVYTVTEAARQELTQGQLRGPAPDAASMAADNVRDAHNRGGFSGQLARNAVRQGHLEELRQAFRDEHGHDAELKALWDKALEDPTIWSTVLFHQFMPLSKVAPDEHCPPEHGVGTCKSGVRAKLLKCDFDDRLLWKGKTYQDMLQEVVKDKLNGEAGQHHISKSVQKQPLICKILAAEEGEDVVLHYKFGQKRADKRASKKRSRPGRASGTEVHTVKGTAGRWIRDSKWT